MMHQHSDKSDIDWPEAVREACALAMAALEPPTIPERGLVLRALREVPCTAVRVVIIGQDPYPGDGHAHGLAFSVNRSVSPLPRSLGNIAKELSRPLLHGDLSRWCAQGVLLLNRWLTLGVAMRPAWDLVTARVLRSVDATSRPVVLAWGAPAIRWAATNTAQCPILASSHPSPLSVRRGLRSPVTDQRLPAQIIPFQGSRPFDRANALLCERGQKPIDW
jgi:uracil-DNA glycosylase